MAMSPRFRDLPVLEQYVPYPVSAELVTQSQARLSGPDDGDIDVFYLPASRAAVPSAPPAASVPLDVSREPGSRSTVPKEAVGFIIL